MVKGLRKLGGSKQAEYDSFGNVLYDVGSRLIPEKVLKIGLGVGALAVCGFLGVNAYKTDQAEKKELAKRQRYEAIQDSLASQELIFETRGLEYLAQGNLDGAIEQAIAGENIRPNIANNLDRLNREIALVDQNISLNQKLADLRSEFNNSHYVIQEGEDLMDISKKYFKAVYGREARGSYPNFWGEGATGDIPELFGILEDIVDYGRANKMFYAATDSLTPGTTIRMPKKSFEKVDYKH
nr:hypothetical protein [Nanoarchaeum sp.]